MARKVEKKAARKAWRKEMKAAVRKTLDDGLRDSWEAGRFDDMELIRFPAPPRRYVGMTWEFKSGVGNPGGSPEAWMGPIREDGTGVLVLAGGSERFLQRGGLAQREVIRLVQDWAERLFPQGHHERCGDDHYDCVKEVFESLHIVCFEYLVSVLDAEMTASYFCDMEEQVFEIERNWPKGCGLRNPVETP